MAALVGGAFLAAIVLGGSPPEIAPPAASGPTAAEVRTDYARLPMSFERNRGQAPGSVDFLARTTVGSFTLDRSGARVSLRGAADQRLQIGLVFQNPSAATPLARDRLGGRVNYLVGDRPSRWHTGVPTFARVRYPGVWPGIDVDWHGDGRRLEYDFRLAEGADPAAIALRVAGVGSPRVAADGDLVISAAGATIRQRAPRAFQFVDGRREPVPVSYAVSGHRVAFRVSAHDASRPLIIDPIVLAYSTYLGGSAGDAENGIAVDASGAAYVVGTTDSIDFNTLGEYEADPGDGNSDVVISKLVPGGNALAYSTYLGGNDLDQGSAVAVDAGGAAYVTGTTNSTNFDTVGQIEGDGGLEDVFISKLVPNGSALAYSTYLGGDTNDLGNAVAVDSAGSAYVTGETTSTNFNTQNAYEGDQPSNDVFVARLTPAGALGYSTYLGGGLDEAGRGIAVDATGAAYVVGGTGSTDFDTQNPYELDSPDSGQSDAFITKFNPAGNTLAYSTYLGGDGTDIGNAIAVDPSRAAYVTGSTGSTDFDSVGAIEGNSVSTDAFVTKLAPAGNALGYSTYLGGNDFDFGSGIAVNAAGSAWVVGTTSSTDFNTVGAIEGDSASDDAFVSEVRPSGSSLAFSTYLGGDDFEQANAVATGPNDAAYVAGLTGSTDFDTVTPIEGDSADVDGFVAKLGAPSTPAEQPPAVEPPTGPSCGGRVATIVGSDANDVLKGTRRSDVIAALGGSDKVRGGGGNDVICAGAGKDRGVGAGGKDRLIGGGGPDKLKGGKKKDVLRGQGGRDRLDGGPANDKLNGGKGKDALVGGPGTDACTGGAKRDSASTCERRRSI
jgi:Ca2+-binding RTX toxin-like protein